MSLHRATEPDWQKVAPGKRSLLQQLAASTNGVVTLGNGITLVGFLLVVGGFILILNAQLMVGVLLIAVGRVADLVDGYIAHRTQTKSPVGEAFDAGIDKLELAIAVPVLLATPYANRLLIAFLLVHLLINVALFFVARQRAIRIHPTRAGKLSTATAWIAAGLFVLSKIDIAKWLQTSISAVAVLCAVIFVALAVVSATQYVKQLQNHVQI